MLPRMVKSSMVAAMSLSLHSSVTAAPSWEFVSSLSVPRQNYGAALGSDGLIYAVGRRVSDGVPDGSVERYDPSTDTWSPGPSLITPRMSHRVIGFGGLIYAIGGTNGTDVLGTMETYDPGESSWILSPHSLNVPRTHFGVTVGHDGRIYAIGGAGQSGIGLTSVEVFDPSNPSLGWQMLGHDLSEGRHVLGAGTDQLGRVYAIGGIRRGGPEPTEDSSVERFDPADPLAGWVFGPSLNQKRQVGGYATASDGSIYVLGGWGPGHLSSVEVYNFASDSWGIHSNMNNTKNNTAAVFDPQGRLYAIGAERFSTFDEVERTVEAVVVVTSVDGWGLYR